MDHEISQLPFPVSCIDFLRLRTSCFVISVPLHCLARHAIRRLHLLLPHLVTPTLTVLQL